MTYGAAAAGISDFSCVEAAPVHRSAAAFAVTSPRRLDSFTHCNTMQYCWKLQLGLAPYVRISGATFGKFLSEVRPMSEPTGSCPSKYVRNMVLSEIFPKKTRNTRLSF